MRPRSGVFKIQKNLVDGDCAEKASSAALRGLKAQQVQSPGQRPGFHVPIPYAYVLIPRALPWAVDWLPFQGAPFRALFVYHVRMLRHLLFGKKTHRDFSGF